MVRYFYDEQENDELKRAVVRLTHASNAYLGELLYGKREDIGDAARGTLLLSITDILLALDIQEKEMAALFSAAYDGDEGDTLP